MAVDTTLAQEVERKTPPRRWRIDIAIALGLVSIVALGVIWGQSTKRRDQHVLQAEGFHNDKEYDRAIAAYTLAIQNDPSCALAYANRASAYFHNGEFKR